MALLRTVLSLLTAIVTMITPIVVWRLNHKQSKKIGEVKDKVDEYHKEINGRMGQLLETTKQLATEKEKAREKGEDKKGPGL